MTIPPGQPVEDGHPRASQLSSAIAGASSHEQQDVHPAPGGRASYRRVPAMSDEELADQLTPTANAGLIEDDLEVVLDCVPGDVEQVDDGEG